MSKNSFEKSFEKSFKAGQLFDKGEYKQAVKILLNLIKRTDCDSYSLGYCYEHGLGVEQDYREAAHYYLEAVNYYTNDPYARAVVRLGYLYEHGLGVERDIDQAIYWYKTMIKFYIPGYYDKQAEEAKNGLIRLGAW